MSINTPKDNPGLLFQSQLLRNTIAAILLSLGLTGEVNEALSCPKNQEQSNAPMISKNPPKTDIFNTTDKQQRCGLTGTLKISGRSIIIQAVCIQGKELSIGELVLLPNKAGHFNIPRTTAYFYLSDDGKPALSFIKNGERITGMMKKDKNGEYSFDQYLDFIE